MSDERAWKTAVVVMRGQVDELRQLKADNARLRALIKDKEYAHVGGEYDEGDGYRAQYDECPWCGGDAVKRHADDCPAFTPEGEVK